MIYLKEYIKNSNNIVFFGGAGVSTESGIPDFRSDNGLYNQKYEYNPETILSHRFFLKNTSYFYKFYKDNMIYLDVQPNITHIKLAELENIGKLKAIITQNIDGLHQKAGSKNVMELHGSIFKNYCMQCKKDYNIYKILESDNLPLCDCGGIIKPDVVLYEEHLNQYLIECSIDAIRNADVLIVGGTSLGVYPAAGLINYYKGDKLVLINKAPTPFDNKANLIINDSLGNIFRNI